MSGPLPEWLAPLTVPASWLYGGAVARRNRKYDAGTGVQRLPVPVISVGNITTGGSGKTPMVMWIAESLHARQVTPLVAMRGYAARPGEVSDEEAEYADRLPGVRVVAHPRRYAAVRAALAAQPADCVILDDGFQHRQLARDLDIVLVRAPGTELRARLLPAGHLREPPTSLRRADAVIVTGAASIDRRLADEITSFHGRPPLAWTRHHWAGLTLHGPEPGAATRVSPVWLEGRRVMSMFGVADPGRVHRQLEAAGASVVHDVPAADHARYDRTRIAAVCARCRAIGAEALVITGKDWVKVRELLGERPWPCPIAVPDLRLEFLDGRERLAALIASRLK